mmetsp:Transcript_69329/g.144558  ORF Transcript_69329/g.144558 Transcript_69329/m.144558 type:complete len:237 (-) Transcript_69329:1885-2595(-)
MLNHRRHRRHREGRRSELGIHPALGQVDACSHLEPTGIARRGFDQGGGRTLDQREAAQGEEFAHTHRTIDLLTGLAQHVEVGEHRRVRGPRIGFGLVHRQPDPLPPLGRHRLSQPKLDRPLGTRDVSLVRPLLAEVRDLFLLEVQEFAELVVERLWDRLEVRKLPVRTHLVVHPLPPGRSSRGPSLPRTHDKIPDGHHHGVSNRSRHLHSPVLLPLFLAVHQEIPKPLLQFHPPSR